MYVPPLAGPITPPKRLPQALACGRPLVIRFPYPAIIPPIRGLYFSQNCRNRSTIFGSKCLPDCERM